MANIAFNIAFVSGYKEELGKEILKHFQDNFDIINEPEEEDIEEGAFEIHFDSRWSTPKDDLLILIEKFAIEIYGVSYERGNLYVSCWNFTSKLGVDNTIETSVNLHEL